MTSRGQQKAQKMKPAKNGAKLWKRIEVKIIIGEKVHRHHFVAPAQRGYSEKQIEETLEKVIEHLDDKFPLLDFKQVQLQPNAFNFIAIGARLQTKVQKETALAEIRGEE